MSEPFNINVHLAREFIRRADTQDHRGKARDKAAIEFWCGAATALRAVKKDDYADAALRYCAFVLCTRGSKDLVRLLDVTEE